MWDDPFGCDELNLAALKLHEEYCVAGPRSNSLEFYQDGDYFELEV